jgi:hypothetical protein
MCAIERNGTQRNQRGIEEHDDIGPLMPHDKSWARIEGLGVFWMHTGAMLERTLHDDRDSPGQLVHPMPGCGQALGLVLGEALQRRDGDRAMGLRHL